MSTSPETPELNSQLRRDLIEKAAVAIAREFFSMAGGDPAWDECPPPNEGDYSLASAVVAALFPVGE